ncbi:MAG: SRPBCC family protein [Bacteroidota bacterium]
MRNTIICLTLAFLPLQSSSQTKEPSNKHFWNTVETSASPEKIWTIWTDVPNWKKWDSGLKDATLDGPFELNAKGKIISLEGRTSRFKVTECVSGKSYTFKSKLPFGALYVKRYLEVKQGVTFFTHEVWFTGLTGGIFAKRFGPEFRSVLPKVMENIKKIAEK